MEKRHFFNGKIHYKWQFLIAMLNYQKVQVSKFLSRYFLGTVWVKPRNEITMNHKMAPKSGSKNKVQITTLVTR